MDELSPLDRVRVALQEIEDSRRTIVCSPDLESRIKSMIDFYGVGGLWTVQVSPLIGDQMVAILDLNAIEASARQFRQRATRWFMLPPDEGVPRA